MLTHGNLRSQIDNFPFFLEVAPGDTALSLLPPWHIYQRTASLYLANRGAKEVYTSKFKFRDDLTAHPPDHFVCVPLVLETLYNKVCAPGTGPECARLGPEPIYRPTCLAVEQPTTLPQQQPQAAPRQPPSCRALTPSNSLPNPQPHPPPTHADHGQDQV